MICYSKRAFLYCSLSTLRDGKFHKNLLCSSLVQWHVRGWLGGPFQSHAKRGCEVECRSVESASSCKPGLTLTTAAYAQPEPRSKNLLFEIHLLSSSCYTTFPLELNYLRSTIHWSSSQASCIMTTRFEYQQLCQSTCDIRLIKILPRNGTGKLKNILACHLFHTSLRGDSKFIALSYVWGDPKDSRIIIIEKKPVRVTQNLYDAMMALRPPKEPIVIWIDALCIYSSRSSIKGSRNQQPFIQH